jgi:L-ribulose-5-phosphate 3-epimerase UlaE
MAPITAELEAVLQQYESVVKPAVTLAIAAGMRSIDIHVCDVVIAAREEASRKAKEEAKSYEPQMFSPLLEFAAKLFLTHLLPGM